MKTKQTFFKKAVVFVIALMLAGNFSFAQTIITIGTGTASNTDMSYPAPYGNYWYGAKNQFIIPASEITSAGGGMGIISSLAFDVSSVQGTALLGFTIKMGTTTASAATTSFVSGLTTVYSSTSYTETAGWNTHTFSTPFSWDGSSNLVIETCFNNTGYTYNASTRWSATTYNSSTYYYADAATVCGTTSGTLSTFRPNMKLGITMGTPPAKDLGILSWDYPNSSCGMSAAEPIIIKVKNWGLASQNSYTLKYSTNGGTTWVSEALTTTLLPGDTLTHTFTTPASFATIGTYNCLAAVILPLDSNSNNDSLTKTVIATAGMSTPYFNNLESMPTGVMTTGDWRSSTTSVPNWQIDVSNTSSSNTGPNKDHTLGTTAGKYAFLECSGGALGSTSYLTSPCINLSNNPGVLNFWYHMYGSTMGTLEVQQKVGGTWITTGWSKTGQQHTSMAAAWDEATISISPAADGIRFKGVRGSSYYSDMAIDDIKLYVPMPNDLALLDWVSPLAGTTPSATMPITVQVFNAGLAAQDTIPIKYSIDGGTTWVSGISYPTLLPGDTLTYTFPTTANMATPGYYSCIGVVSNPGDGAVVNDTIFVNPYLCTSLSGTYLIGSGTTADFATFSDAVFALNNCGVSGAVTINVDTGTYTEQVNIGAINGASATNTITFKSATGDSTDVVLTNAATGPVLLLNGADYIIVKNISIIGTGSATYALQIHGGATHNVFESNIIQLPISTSSTYRTIYDYTTLNHYNTYRNNLISGGYYSMYIYGVSTTSWQVGTVIEGNEIVNSYYYPMYVYYSDSVQIINNYIHNGASPYSYGIYCYYINNEYRIIGNRVEIVGTSTSACYGIREYYGNYYSYNATPSGYGLVANNMISISGGTGTNYGYYAYYGNGVKYYYNSISITTGNTTSRCLYQYNTASNTLGQTFKNNIFANNAGGYAAYFNTPASVIASDYNDFYTTGVNLAYWLAAKTTLTALQTASSKDANSVNIIAPYTSSTDLHLMGTALSALGTPLTAVTVDIDGTPRGLAPTIGAHEVPLLPWDAGVFNVTAPIPNDTVTEGATVPLTVIVKNYGTNTITSMIIEYSVNNGTPVIYTYTGTLLPNATASVTLTSFTATAGFSNVCVKTVLVGDSNSFNDEYCQPFFGTPLKDATVLEIIEIADDCNIGLDTVQIMVQNVGIDIINGTSPTLITAHYQLNGVSPIVTDTITQLINPTDTILFSFDVLGDFTVTTMDSVFNIVAWVNLVNDNVPANDTAFSDVESFGVPNSPIVSNTFIPYATSATLTAISPDTILWYQHDTSSVPLAGGPTFITPILTDTTTYWVQAGIKISGTGANVAPLAVASASSCQTGPCTSFNDLNFGSCGSQQVWLSSSASNPGSSIFIQFDWPSTKTINKMTIHAGQNNTRFLTGGTIQIWDGSAWVFHHSFTQAIGVCFYDIIFPNASTTKLRIIDMTVGGSQSSNVNFREIEIFEAVGGCASVRVPVVVNVGPPPPVDAGVYDITSPSGSAPGGTPTPITVRIKNYGTNTLTNAVINWSLNDVTRPSFTWTGGSVAFDSISQPITIYTDTFKGGLYNLKAWTTMPNGVTDPSPANDTANTSFTACLNGTFTIGGPTADFASFTEAVAAMDLISICGPVVFNVASGTYTEQLTITAINGGSATNTVTFKSASGVNTDVILQYAATGSATNWTVQFNGADYITLKQMTIKATGASYGRVIQFISGANYNTIDSCKIMMTTTTTSGNFAGIYSYNTKDEFNTISNNEIIGGYYGIYFYGGTTTTNLGQGNVIDNNSITDYYYYGLYSYYHDALQFTNNYLESRTNSGGAYGTRFYYCDATTVTDNIMNIHGTSTLYGIYMYYNDSTATSRVLVANNFITTSQGTGTHYGIYFRYGKGADIYYNSVNNLNGSTSSYPLYFYNNNTSYLGCNVVNNIFANNGSGYAGYIYNNTYINADYNNYYRSTTGNLLYWQGYKATLAALKTVYANNNVNSISTDPAYLSNTDLHLSLTSSQNLGTPIAGVTDDIDGETRSTTAPDIGADEWDPLAHDLRLTEFIAPNSSMCGNVADSIRVVLMNMGLNAETNVPISAIVNTPTGTVSTNIIMSNIPSGYNDTIVLGTVNTTSPGNYVFTVYPTLASDLDHTNDTIVATTATNQIFAVPHMEDFNTSPYNWATTSSMNIGTGHGLTSNALYVNMYSSTAYQTANMTNKIGPIPVNASLTFDYRVTNYTGGAATTLGNDSINIWVTDNCGTSWSLLYSINSISHVSSASMEKVIIPLTALLGDNILIAVECIWATGDYYVDIDNVGIGLPPIVNLGADVTICDGDTATFDAGTYAPSIITYEWFAVGNMTAIGTSQILAVDTAASYYVEVKNEFGLMGTDTVVLTVNPSPTVTMTGLAASYCIDGMISTLTGTPTGGVFTGAGITANVFDPAVAGVGTFDISYSFTNTSGCTTIETQSVTVNPIPVVVASPDAAMCFGDSTTICVLSPTLFFSEYQEGSSNNKALEIYNGTGATVYLDNYAFPNVSNAPNTVGEYEYWNTFTAGDSILDGDVYVVAHGSANAAMLAVADMTHTYLSNGDDGFALVMNDGVWNDLNSNNIVDEGEMTGFTVLDWIGNWQGDPGSGWDVAGVTNGTKEHTLVRKTEVFSGNTNWADAAGTDSLSSEWIVYPQNTFTYLGTHTAVSVSAGTYLWSNAATTQSIKVSPAITTVYTVIVTDANSCTNTDSVVVTINPLPIVDLGPDQSVCDVSLVLDAGAGAGYIYLWSDSSTMQTLIIDSSGYGYGTFPFWVTVVDSLNCTAIDTIFITFAPATSVDLGADVIICINHTYDLDAGTGFATYNWSTSETTQIITIDGAILGVGVFPYSVTVTDISGCMAYDTIIVTVDSCVSVGEIDNNVSVKLFPNPSNGMFNLSINGISGNIDMQILDASGRLISNEKLIGIKSGYIKEFDVSYLAKGIYYIKLMNNDIIKLEKLVIQ